MLPIENKSRFWPGETVLTGADLGGREFRVCRSAAGYYIGTQGIDGPYSRESVYFDSEEKAQALLDEWLVFVNAYLDDDANATSISAANVGIARKCYLDDLFIGARS